MNPYQSPQTPSEPAAVSGLQWCGHAAGCITATILLFPFLWMFVASTVHSVYIVAKNYNAIEWAFNRSMSMAVFCLVGQIAYFAIPVVLIWCYERYASWRYNRWRKQFERDVALEI